MKNANNVENGKQETLDTTVTQNIQPISTIQWKVQKPQAHNMIMIMIMYKFQQLVNKYLHFHLSKRTQLSKINKFSNLTLIRKLHLK